MKLFSVFAKNLQGSEGLKDMNANDYLVSFFIQTLFFSIPLLSYCILAFEISFSSNNCAKYIRFNVMQYLVLIYYYVIKKIFNRVIAFASMTIR